MALRLLKNNYNNAFLALVRAGLFDSKVQLLPYEVDDLSKIVQLADEQSVIGLVAVGLGNVTDFNVPQSLAITIAGRVLKLEQRNLEMNAFVAELIDKLQAADIFALLVKGQGIAQCYDKPLWRSCGDIDLFLSESNYNKAKEFLTSVASQVDEERPYALHLEMIISSWVVELHGTLRSGLWRRIDKVNDDAQNVVFSCGKVRSWMDGNTRVFMPGVDEDVFFVFTHILQHFFKGGIGLRQICDWCRLLWTYRGTVNLTLLEHRLKIAGIMTEWKVFAALAVEFLGMSEDIIPLYSSDAKWKRKASRVMAFLLETGNFGQSRDKSYITKVPYLKRKIISFSQNTTDSLKQAMIFPLDACKVWWVRLFEGIASLARCK